MQLMHCGRLSHPSLLPHRALQVAPSAIKPDGQVWTGKCWEDFVSPRALGADEIKNNVIRAYGLAVRRALEAGFDGVELLSGAGYLPEQFLSPDCNQRQDKYGGSIANRVRFVLEILEAMISEAGAGCVGLKISPGILGRTSSRSCGIAGSSSS